MMLTPSFDSASLLEGRARREGQEMERVSGAIRSSPSAGRIADLATLQMRRSKTSSRNRFSRTEEMSQRQLQIPPIAADQLWGFWQEMAPGDFVCAYSASQVFGWGMITGDYRYEDDERGYQHRRAVDWRSVDMIPVDRLSAPLREKLTQHDDNRGADGGRTSTRYAANGGLQLDWNASRCNAHGRCQNSREIESLSIGQEADHLRGAAGVGQDVSGGPVRAVLHRESA